LGPTAEINFPFYAVWWDSSLDSAWVTRQPHVPENSRDCKADEIGRHTGFLPKHF
jgi:hypothetical protein